MDNKNQKRRASQSSLPGLEYDSSRHVDFVLVYSRSAEEGGPFSKQRKKKNRKIFLENLKAAGLKITRVFSLIRFEKKSNSLIYNKVIFPKIHEGNGTVYILLFTPFWKLLEIAEKVKLKLPIEVNEIATKSYFKNLWRRSNNKQTTCDGDQSKLDYDDVAQTRYFTAPYTSVMHSKFARFFNKNDPEDTLSVRNRCLLTYEILNRTSYSKLENNISLEETNSIKLDFNILKC